MKKPIVDENSFANMISVLKSFAGETGGVSAVLFPKVSLVAVCGSAPGGLWQRTLSPE